MHLPHPVIFAHRGSSAHAPENTLAAFKLAVQQKADAIELDATLSSDGNVVVFHDDTLERTTGAAGRLRDLSLEQLRMLDAGSHFGPPFHGEKIPSLEEVFQAVGNDLVINIELKNYGTPFDHLPQKVVELVKQYGLEKTVLFSSFNPIALQRVQNLLPQAPRGLLTLPGATGVLTRTIAGMLISYQALHPEESDVTPELIQKVHDGGRNINVYTVNDPEKMRCLFIWKVDGIITDDPVLAYKVRAEVVGKGYQYDLA